MKKTIAAVCLAMSVVLGSNSYGVTALAAEQTTITPTKDDETIIPDKYNTGCKGDLIKYTSLSADEKLEIMDGIKTVYSAGTKINWAGNYIKAGKYVIENVDFSDEIFAFNNSTNLDVEITFNNCKFSSLTTGGNVKTTLNNCTLEKIVSRDVTLNYCQLGHSVSDPIRPFNNSYFNNCYITDLQYYYPNVQHIDGVQIYGNLSGNKDIPGKDTTDIHFKNCRFEIPTYYTGEGNVAGMNDCIFVQNEYAKVSDVTFEDIITNGANVQFSAHRYTPKNATEPKYDLENVSLKNCRMGEGSILGIMIAVEPFVEVTNTGFSPLLYVGSSWQDSEGTHFSVTNDSLHERQLTIVTDKGVFTETIPAFPDPKVTNQSTNTLTYKDYPIDIDIKVPADEYAVCYDTTTAAKQIRFVNYTNNDIAIDDDILDQYCSGSEVIKSGNISKKNSDVSYTLTNDGILTISGTGAMKDFHSQDVPPWKDDYVSKVIIEEGVTAIGNQAFKSKYTITDFTFPSTLQSMGGMSLSGCNSVERITIPADFATFGKNALQNNYRLKINYEGADWDAIEGGEPYKWMLEGEALEPTPEEDPEVEITTESNPDDTYENSTTEEEEKDKGTEASTETSNSTTTEEPKTTTRATTEASSNTNNTSSTTQYEATESNNDTASEVTETESTATVETTTEAKTTTNNTTEASSSNGNTKNDNKKNTDPVVSTGDDFNTTRPLLLILVSCAGIIICLDRKKKLS